MVNGYISLHRALMEKPIWLNSTPEQKTILITILLTANYSPKQWEWQGNKFNLKAGQFITSLDKLATKCGKGITCQHVRTALGRFEKLEFLTNQSTKTGRLITIVNWGQYQDSEKQSNKDTNKDLTDNQQTTNKDLTTNNNNNNNNNKRKNIKKEKPVVEKVSFAEFVSMTNDEYSSLVTKYGESGTRRMIEILDNYKGSSGNTYKSDYRAILNWVVGRYTSEKLQSNNDLPEF